MRRDVGDLLLEERLITEGVLRAARRLAKRERMPVVAVLLEEEHLGEDQLVELLARRLKLPVVDPARLTVDEDVLREIPYDLAEKHRVLPVALEEEAGRRGPPRLRTAMADPLDREAIEELEAVTGHAITPVIAPALALLGAIRYRYRGAITQLVPRSGRVDLGAPSEQTPRPTLRHPEDMVTQPLLRLGEEQPLDLRLRALLVTLFEAGVITQRAYAEVLHRLTRDTSDS